MFFGLFTASALVAYVLGAAFISSVDYYIFFWIMLVVRILGIIPFFFLGRPRKVKPDLKDDDKEEPQWEVIKGIFRLLYHPKMILLYPLIILISVDITIIDSLFFILIDETMGNSYST